MTVMRRTEPRKRPGPSDRTRLIGRLAKVFLMQQRRHFLESLGSLTVGGLLASSVEASQPRGDALPDPARELRPSSADLGSLYVEVQRLTEGRAYEYAFLGQRFRDLDEFKKTARAKVFELLL